MYVKKKVTVLCGTHPAYGLFSAVKGQRGHKVCMRTDWWVTCARRRLNYFVLLCSCWFEVGQRVLAGKKRRERDVGFALFIVVGFLFVSFSLCTLLALFLA